MWVFDGEEWTEDNGNDQTSGTKKSETPAVRYNELMPELQVIEIVPVTQKHPVPPFPLP